MTKVAICLPSHGGAHRPFERCLSALRHARPDWGVLELSGSPCVDIARSAIARAALRDGFDILLWLDADMVFSTATCESIVADAERLQSVVGCLYSGKKFGARVQAAFFPETKTLTCFAGGGLVEIEAIGFGVVAHPASMLEPMAQASGLRPLTLGRFELTPWFTSDPAWESFHSDDFSFCRRARAAGYKIWADTRQRVGHCGTHVYTLEDAALKPMICDSLELSRELTSDEIHVPGPEALIDPEPPTLPESDPPEPHDTERPGASQEAAE